MNNDLMFSSKTGKWDTPKTLVDDLSTVFDWDLDVCASSSNVCHNYYSEEMDGLRYSWRGLCWMNPPYGRKIGYWVNHARCSKSWYKIGKIGRKYFPAIVCLLPSRTDTRWWHDNITFASQVVFIKGRLKFGGAKNSAPFPSAFVVFGNITLEQRLKLNSYGWNPNGLPPIMEMDMGTIKPKKIVRVLS